MSMENTTRIEYIDAMRGFTILLVVMTHVSGFVLRVNMENAFSLNSVFSEFRMPLFFFVSGFVFNKKGVVWDSAQINSFFRKKVSVQIFSPLLFIVCFVYSHNYDLRTFLFAPDKMGYWFTFTLFEFFVIFVFLNRLFTMIKFRTNYSYILYVIIGCFFYVVCHDEHLIQLCKLKEGLLGLLGVTTWCFFVFFILGAIVREYYEKFCEYLDSKYVTLVCVSLFVILNVFGLKQFLGFRIFTFSTAVLGICILFALFRKHQETFSSKNKMGRLIQYVGRRTLDIYLIHYFFIDWSFASAFLDFSETNTPFFEFVVSLSISVIIIIACLIVSAVLRLNPLMAHYLFGQKNNK